MHLIGSALQDMFVDCSYALLSLSCSLKCYWWVFTRIASADQSNAYFPMGVVTTMDPDSTQQPQGKLGKGGHELIGANLGARGKTLRVRLACCVHQHHRDLSYSESVVPAAASRGPSDRSPPAVAEGRVEKSVPRASASTAAEDHHRGHHVWSVWGFLPVAFASRSQKWCARACYTERRCCASWDGRGCPYAVRTCANAASGSQAQRAFQ